MKKLQLLFIILFFTVSCSSSKVTVSSEFKESAPRLIALLPIKGTLDLSDTRLNRIEKLIRSELQFRGYTLIEESLIKKTCPTNDCKDVAKFFSKYGVSAYAKVNIESFSRNNFGLGFYNTISGSISFFDPSDKELLKVAHSEKEKGGVLFQSGQVFQGIAEQFKNSGDDAFLLLAEKFSHELALSVPYYQSKVEGGNTLAQSKLEIVSMDEIKPDLYKICVKSDKDFLVNLIYKKEKVSLQGDSAGIFCRILKLQNSDLSNNKIYIEARSAYGDTVRKDLVFSDEPVCVLDDKTTLVKVPNKNELSINIDCKLVEHQLGTLIACQDSNRTCTVKKLVIYQADSEVGPYAKLIEVSKLDKTSFPKIPGLKKYIQMVTIGKGNNYSLPFAPNIK